MRSVLKIYQQHNAQLPPCASSTMPLPTHTSLCGCGCIPPLGRFIENFPGFPEPILGADLCDRFRKQSKAYGTTIYTETVDKVELSQGTPFVLHTSSKEVTADAVILATGAAARKLPIKGLDQYWNNGISACAVCDGSSPLFR